MFEYIIYPVRVNFGLIGSIMILAFWLVVFPLEIALILVILPFMLIFKDRNSIKESFVVRFPNSLRMLGRQMMNFWDWVLDD